jgi:ubiquinone/menaquinone biosynthesis C-methylase UbiE
MLRVAIVVAAAWGAGCGGGTPTHTEPAHAHGHGHDGPLVHRFDDAAHWAREFDDPARDEWQKPAEVVRAMGIEAGDTVADLGAGTGYFLPHLSKAVGARGHVIGLDIEESMVRWMRDRIAREGLTNAEARVVPFGDPQLADGSVDHILVVDTWHHIGDRGTYARRLHLALRPGGAVWIVDFTRDSPRGPPPEHRLTPESVIAELTLGGLEADIVEEPLPWQYIVRGKRP